MLVLLICIIIYGLVIFFIPLTNKGKIKRLNSHGFTKVHVTKRGIYKGIFLGNYKGIRGRFKFFICFGYIEVKEFNWK